MDNLSISIQEQLIDYIHGELKGDDLQQFELILAKDEQIQQALHELKQTIVEPDLSIVFPDKTILYKNKSTFIPFFNKQYMAVAASALLILGIGWIWNQLNKVTQKPVIVHEVLDTNTQPVLPNNVSDSTPTKKQQQVVKLVSTTHNRKIKNSIVQTSLRSKKEILQRPIENIITTVNQVEEEKHWIDNTTVINQPPSVDVPTPNEDHMYATDQQIQSPKTAPQSVASSHHNQSIVLSEANQPKLFSVIHKASKIIQTIRNTTHHIRQRELVVMVGQKKIFDFNHF